MTVHSGSESSARYKLDENVPWDAALIMRGAGHDCHTVYEENLVGARDGLVAEACRREQRVLITLDLDFSDIRAYPPGTHPGIIVLRPHRADKHMTLRLLMRTSHLLRTQSPSGQVWIVDERRVRMR